MHLTRAQSAILGYLISTNTSESAGNTVKEIIAATGLGQNTVYENLRRGVPGVLKCTQTSLTGADMYYVNPSALKEATASLVLPSVTTVDSPLQMVQWDKAPENVKAGLEKTYLGKNATWDRLGELMAGFNQIPNEWNDKARLYQTAILGQAIALIAFDLIEKGD